jgi:hypothetical protein
MSATRSFARGAHGAVKDGPPAVRRPIDGVGSPETSHKRQCPTNARTLGREHAQQRTRHNRRALRRDLGALSVCRNVTASQHFLSLAIDRLARRDLTSAGSIRKEKLRWR